MNNFPPFRTRSEKMVSRKHWALPLPSCGNRIRVGGVVAINEEKKSSHISISECTSCAQFANRIYQNRHP